MYYSNKLLADFIKHDKGSTVLNSVITVKTVEFWDPENPRPVVFVKYNCDINYNDTVENYDSYYICYIHKLKKFLFDNRRNKILKLKECLK